MRVLDGAERVNHRGRVHPELNDEAQQECQVAVLGGEAAEQHAETERERGDEQYEYRREQRVQIRVYRGVGEYQVIREHQEKQPHLDAEPHEVARDGRKRHNEPREIHLAEHVRVLYERFARLVQAFRKIRPEADARQVEQRLRQTVRRDFRDAAEHDHEHHGRHDGLYKEPQRSENSLFVPRNDIALHEHAVQIAVLPDFAEVDREQARFRLDDCGPFAHRLLPRARLERPFAHHVLRRLVDADVDAAHVFADEPEQEHDHAADKQQGGEHAGVAHRDSGVHQFLVDDEDTRGKSDKGAEEPDVGGGTQRFHGECRKPVNPEPDKARERIARLAFEAATVLHGHVAQVLGRTEYKPAYVGEGVRVAHNLFDDELAHDEEARGA